MCGLAGIFNYKDHQSVNRNLAANMVKKIEHRGPDDEGSYFCDKAGLYLGHRRLSIIDLSAGHQPMTNEDESVWIVFNGEIYNFKELRSELEAFGHVFKTNSDTETIVHAYEQWGVESFSRLNGMFAFALWDEPKRALYLTRDPFGVKPLYYFDDGKSLIFGSEIKALLAHPNVKPTVDFQALGDFLSYTYVPAPKTVFAGIYKLQPGYFLQSDPNGNQIQPFYKKSKPMFSRVSEDQLVDELQHLIYQATKRQMISDVPIGAMLSGGVDSSTMVTLMTEINSAPIKTFTVGFAEDFDSNESGYARSMAARIGSHHQDIEIASSDYSDFLPRSIYYLEEPIATGSTLAYYMICKLARESVKVVLTGQGADEPFAGYHRHLGEYNGGLYRSIPGSVRNRLIAPLVELLPRNEALKRAVRSVGITDPVERISSVYNTVENSLKLQLFKDDLLAEDSTYVKNLVGKWQSDVADRDGLSQMLYIDSRLSLSDNLLMYGDKMSMAVSLEARVPFLDLDLMEYVERIPSSFKIRGKTQKYILKKAVSRWIPKEVIKRPKIGFTTPLDNWFQKELSHDITDQLLASGSACSEFLHGEAISKMIEEHQTRKQDHKRILFSLLTFELWYQQFIKSANN